MKKVLLPIMILCLFYPTFAQTVEPVVLVNVGLDSLKKVVEQKSEYHLYYIQNPNETPTKLSVSWNRTNFLDQLQSALHQAGCSLSQMGSMLFVIKGAGIISKLPDHYFSLSQEPEQDAASIASLMASYRNIEAGSANKIYTIGDPNTVSSGNRAILSGYIKNANTGEPITTASIVVPSTGTAVITDRHGFYRITVPLGKTDIVLKEYTFEETPVMLEVFADGTLDILMREKFYSLNEVVVSADAYQQRRTTHVGLEKIQVARIRHIPTVFGEADVLKVVLTLPGVKTVGESSGGFNVRGGATDQNLILFNGGTLYNPTHLFGLFSAFNPDVVSDIELYKSTIPAKYGGRISSVLEVNNRQGNSNKITGSAGIGLLTGKFHLEGPIIKEKTNFIVGARTTYSNWMLKMLPQNSGYRDGSADFSDVTASISQKINSNNTLYLYGYYSGDRFSFSQDTTYSYQNVNLAFKWRSNLGAKQNMTFSAGYDRYAHNVEEKANPVQAYDMRFELEQLNLKTNFDWHVSESHAVNYGINGLHYTLSPGSFLPHGPASIVTPDVIDRESGLELSLYVSDKWDLSHRFTIDFGIRYTFYSAMGPASYYRYRDNEKSEETVIDIVHVDEREFVKPYHGPEFRLSARYLVNDVLTIKAGINSMRQNIHMLSNTVSTAPTDIWKLSDAHIQPQTGWQAAAGIYRSFLDNQYELSVEGYYKLMEHYLDYKSGAVINMNKHIERDVVETEGKAYGVELMLKKNIGKLNGWLSYAYSRTMLKEAGIKDFYEINNGEWYPAAYDKPHDVKVIANYKFTQRYSLSANLDYATGRPVTIPIGVYYYKNDYWLAYSSRNQYRIPDYFRLDLAFNIEPSHNLKLLTHSVFTFGVYNVTGRKNAFSVFYAKNEKNRISGYKLSIFGVPIPYVNYTIKF